mgnify:CR=1 FL=1
MLNIHLKLLLVAVMLTPAVLSCKTAKRTQRVGVETAAVVSSTPEYKANMSPQAKRLLKDLEAEDLHRQPFVPSAGFLDKYGLQVSGDICFVRGMIRTTEKFDRAAAEQLGVILSPPAGRIIPVSVPVQQLPTLLQQEGIEYFEMSGGAVPAGKQSIQNR